MSRRLLFLDFDGVVVTADYQREHGAYGLDPEKMMLLDAFVRIFNVYIIVSSNWRRTVTDMRELLGKYGLKNPRKRVIGITPYLRDHCRGSEIGAWLAGYRQHHDSIAILDDDDDMGDYACYLVRTDYRQGLTDGTLALLLTVYHAQESISTATLHGDIAT